MSHLPSVVIFSYFYLANRFVSKTRKTHHFFENHRHHARSQPDSRSKIELKRNASRGRGLSRNNLYCVPVRYTP